ncbi:SHOCT domain-containing protein [Parathalassolituus penaei]|uniref:SHOCT domain-containing protein n=1 Tax=Parathalassolituus penaei TaxID=2997323 RepID=A0A9X3ED10_9GAMM|nr:SHOCT domain-containing protein [Parathalassolituus penaei]MCY0964564.1 SHOCT domain-containing protein [Parathalassolituus penaei]
MNNLSQYGQGVVNDLSWRYGLSADTVINMIQAVINGNGTMAQFYSPELGGSGQWMSGGMTMVGDMFNQGLKNTVNNLCSEISGILMSGQLIFEPAPVTTFDNNGNQTGTYQSNGNWWPAELGWPSSSGAQNSIRYAIFPDSHRLALDINGQVTVYDTLDHQIGGVGQQQGNGYSLTFSSQYGTVAVDSLPLAAGFGGSNQSGNSGYNQPVYEQPAQNSSLVDNNGYTNNAGNGSVANTSGNTSQDGSGDIIATIERLAELHNRGILSDAEFSSKKAELLQRL